MIASEAAYFLPMLYRAGFRAPPAAWPHGEITARGWQETAWLLLLPPLCTAAATLGVGILADAAFSPLAWAQLIAGREYVSLRP